VQNRRPSHIRRLERGESLHHSATANESAHLHRPRRANVINQSLLPARSNSGDRLANRHSIGRYSKPPFDRLLLNDLIGALQQ